MSFVETAIRRLSPLRRGNLQRRLMERFEAHGGCYEPGCKCRSTRAYAILGRFSALTAGLEVR